ncbi:MAG: hypothetical protein ABR953_13690 [Candidatus Acidiferrales bacterium]
MSSSFQSRFGQAVDAYVAFCPEYPHELFERILAAVSLDHRDRAMDLGAATGKSARALLDHFSEVVAVEPDALMALYTFTRRSRALWSDLESRYERSWPGEKIPVDFSPWLLLARKD